MKQRPCLWTQKSSGTWIGLFSSHIKKIFSLKKVADHVSESDLYCIIWYCSHVQAVAGCESLLQKVERSSALWCTCCAFYRPKANLFCSKWPNSRVWSDFRVILSNRNLVFMQLATPLPDSWVVKRTISLFDSLCSNVPTHVVRFNVAWGGKFRVDPKNGRVGDY